MADNKLPKNLPNRQRTWLTPRQKLALIRQVEEGRFSVLKAYRCSFFSSKTPYTWKKQTTVLGNCLFVKKGILHLGCPRRTALASMSKFLKAIKKAVCLLLKKS